jgi:hypothetical protein
MHNNIDDLVDEHWQYTKEIMELMYKKAFIHGYKHGYDDAIREC